MNAETVADGVVGKTEDGHDLISFERRIPHPIEAVWAALTEPVQLLEWWGRAEVELEVGGAFSLWWLNEGDEGEGSVLEARIAELEPPRVLDLAGTWATERADGERFDQSATRLRFELEPDGAATVLRFANTLDFGEERFRTIVPAGWHFHLDALATALDGGSTDLVNVGDGWDPIHTDYEERQRSAA